MGFAKMITFFFLMMALLGAPTMATEYKVGDDAGWTTGVDYQAWASKHSFRQGDSLRFVFQRNHDVEQLRSQEEFIRCMSSPNPIMYPPGASVPLNDVGTYYFICGFPNMCQSGMKLQITVLPADVPPFFPQTPPFTIYPAPFMPLRPHAAASTLSLHTCLNIALLVFTLFLMN